MPSTTHAQDTPSEAEKQRGEKLEQLKKAKKAYRAFQDAGAQDNYAKAYAKLAEAIRLAKETGPSKDLNILRDFQQRLPTKWGNEAMKAGNYERALMHFERGIEFSANDAYVYYGKGLALSNIDRTEAALRALEQAVTVGQAHDDERTADLARAKIRDLEGQRP